MPSNALDLALFLESDRMGFLLDVVTPQLVNGQRDVVKNERRQSYENAPYGMSNVRLTELMYPKTHPYYWPVIGYMEDLQAATHEAVKEFFPKYQQAHPNITVQYDALPWNEIAKVVPLGVQSGSAHDVFQLPLNISTAQAVNEGWLMALDDIIPDFANWKQSFPTGVLLEGITSFGGKTYTLPLSRPLIRHARPNGCALRGVLGCACVPWVVRRSAQGCRRRGPRARLAAVVPFSGRRVGLGERSPSLPVAM